MDTDIPASIERSAYVLRASLALLLVFRHWRTLDGSVDRGERKPAGELYSFASATAPDVVLAIQFEQRELVAERGASYQAY